MEALSSTGYEFVNTSRPHTCRHCASLLRVDLSHPPSDGSTYTSLDGLKVKVRQLDARAALLNRCELMRWIFREWLKCAWPKNPAVGLQFRFVARGDVFENVLQIVVSLDDPRPSSEDHESQPAEAAMFNIAAYHGDPAADWVLRRPSAPSATLEVGFDLARTWIEACCDDHYGCRGKDPDFVPTRLLDLGRNDKDVPPILRERIQESVEYAALSYCWGGDQPVKTTMATLEKHCKGMDLLSLPRSLQDAITCTQNLGIQYLWIDCLSIIQDDPVDMATEIANMPRVFGEAHVTICAAGAKSCGEGFLQIREPRTNSIYSYTLPFISTDGSKGTILVTENHSRDGIYMNAIPEEHISTRGWTLQETLLARRMVIYGERDLRWTCRGISHLDDWCMPLYENAAGNYDIRNFEEAGDLKSPFTNRLIAPSSILAEWSSLVSLYTSRKLSRYEDRLLAVSAIAKSYSSVITGRYLAGVWEYNLITQLLWQRGVDYESVLYDNEEKPINWITKKPRYYESRGIPRLRFPTYVAPSWSWASSPDSIRYEDFVDYSSYASAEVIECEVESLFASAPFGAVKSGHLTIKGRLLHTTLQNSSIKEISSYTFSIWHGAPNMPEGELVHDALEEDWPRDGLVDAWCLEIVPELEAVENSPLGLILEFDGENYKRVGSFKYPRWRRDQRGEIKNLPKTPWPWEPEPRTITIL